MKPNFIKLNHPTANNKNRNNMKQFYHFKHVLFSLCLMAFSIGVQAQTTYDWDNAAPDGNFKQGAAGVRWNPGGLFDEPPYGIVQFNNNNQTTMTNNVAGTWSQFKINFGASATTARTIGGNTIQFFDFGGTWPFVRNQSTANHTINFPIQIGASGTFNLELVPFSGNLTFGGTIDNQGKTLHVYGNNAAVDATNRAATLSGVVSGSGKLIVSQFGVAKLNATHTYTGNTEIDNGELWIESAGSIASGSAIFVGNGAQLANVTKFWISNSSGGSTVSNAITINNGNATTRYLGGLNSSGTHTFSGAITNNSTTGGLYLSGLTSGGTTTFSGVISGGGAVITEGAGTVILSGASQNTWTSTLTANGTLLVLNKSADTRAIGTGNMTIATGATVRTDANNQLGTGTPSLITINGTGIFNLNNTNQKIALASASSTASVTLGSGTLNIDNTGTDTYAGTISGCRRSLLKQILVLKF
jgi:fibronectin-binding autotransporter adhesin